MYIHQLNNDLFWQVSKIHHDSTIETNLITIKSAKKNNITSQKRLYAPLHGYISAQACPSLGDGSAPDLAAGHLKNHGRTLDIHQEHWIVGKTQRTCWMFKTPCLIAGKTYLSLITLQGEN
jgi:hypothetical protein